MEMEKNKLFDIEKNHIQEMSRLSKRIVISETERINLLNKIDLLQNNNDEYVKKYNELTIETYRKVSLQAHLNQVGDLKRFITILYSQLSKFWKIENRDRWIGVAFPRNNKLDRQFF